MPAIPASSWVDLCNTFSQLLLTFSPLSLLFGLHRSTTSSAWISSETLIHLSVAFLIRYHFIYSTLFSGHHLLEKLHLIFLLSALYVTRKSQSQLQLPSSSEPLLVLTPDLEDDKQLPITSSPTSRFPFHPFRTLFFLSGALLFSLSMVFVFAFDDDRDRPSQPNFPFTITASTIELISFFFQCIQFLALIGFEPKDANAPVSDLIPWKSLVAPQIPVWMGTWIVSNQAGFALRLPEMAKLLLSNDAGGSDWIVGSIELSTVLNFFVFYGFALLAPKPGARVGRD